MAWLETGGANVAIGANNWLGTRNAQPLIIRTDNAQTLPMAGTEVMRITPATGLGAAVQARSVGIGTTEPNAKLHVNWSGTPGDPSSSAFPAIHAGGGSAALSFASQTYESGGVQGAFLPDGSQGRRWQWYARSDDGEPSSARLWGGGNHLYVTARGQVLLHPERPSPLATIDSRVFYPAVPIGALPTFPPSVPEPGELVLGGTRTSLRGFDGAMAHPAVPPGFGMHTGRHVIRTNGHEWERWIAFNRIYKLNLNPNPTILEAYVPWHAPSFNTGSDARMKTSVRQVEGALEKLELLRGVAFEWAETDKPNAVGGVPGQPSLGVVAQEVEEVFPELVSIYDPDQEYKSVNYDGLTSVLIEAVKELKAQNEALRARIDALEVAQK
jgi:hypothetical protein